MDPEVFEAAADLIDKHGWWNGEEPAPWVTHNGTHCTVMALEAVAPGDASLVAFAEFVGVKSYGLTGWNDLRVDGAEVCTYLRKFAEHVRGEA